ncbi:MAG: methyltransferase domain-containing protein [Firmicutes bacterium]|nr:methyltransferase domain-containing protein [Bacillota bacterium]
MPTAPEPDERETTATRLLVHPPSEVIQADDYEAIRAYYRQTLRDYRLLWFNDETLAYHYGYWDRGVHSHQKALLRLNEKLYEISGATKNASILDAGCGVGGTAVWLARHHGGPVVGINIVEDQITQANANCRRLHLEDSVSFYVEDYCNTSFPDDSFDQVWAIESLCHALDKRRFCEEAFRLLRPGGILLMSDFLLTKHTFSSTEERWIRQWNRGWVTHFTTLTEMRRMIEDTGFEQVQASDHSAYVAPSVKRLHHMALLTTVPAITGHILGQFVNHEWENYKACFAQYRAFRNDLWRYGIIRAEKPA